MKMKMTTRGTLGSLLVGGASLLVASSAGAQDASKVAAAQQLFDEGIRLMDERKYAAACPKFALSQRLDAGGGTALRLADCYEKNGQTASAWATYLDVVPLTRVAHPDWAEQAKARAAALEPSLSRLTILVPPASDVPGLTVERDGAKVEREEWGSAMPVDPGAHPVVATAPAKQQWSTTVAVAPNGARAEVTIPSLIVEQETPGAAGTVAPAVTGTQAPMTDAVRLDKGTTSDGSTQRTIGLVVGGVGAVGVALGGIFGLAAKATYDDAKTHCTSDNRCSPDGVSGVDKAHGQATLSTIVMGVGAAALVGGIVLYFTAPSARPTGVTLRVAPAVDTRGASMTVGGAW